MRANRVERDISVCECVYEAKGVEKKEKRVGFGRKMLARQEVLKRGNFCWFCCNY